MGNVVHERGADLSGKQRAENSLRKGSEQRRESRQDVSRKVFVSEQIGCAVNAPLKIAIAAAFRRIPEKPIIETPEAAQGAFDFVWSRLSFRPLEFFVSDLVSVIRQNKLAFMQSLQGIYNIRPRRAELRCGRKVSG
ncbi:hypothetical protein [Arenibacterium sp. CAU 1754]